MPTILKISEASTIAFHAMGYLAANEDRPVSVTEISAGIKVSANHLSKVFQRLAKSGLVRSTRGPAGGFRLARKARKITLLDVFQAIEGPIAKSTCLLNAQICDGKKCILGNLLGNVNNMVKKQFSKTNLSQLAEIFGR